MTEQVSKKQAVVVQGNELIVETSNSMKMNQLKILYFLMSCIEREDELFFPIEVDYKTLLAIINYDSNKGGKKAYLTDLLEDMAQKSYYIYNKERITVFPWFGCIQIDRDIETVRRSSNSMRTCLSTCCSRPGTSRSISLDL